MVSNLLNIMGSQNQINQIEQFHIDRDKNTCFKNLIIIDFCNRDPHIHVFYCHPLSSYEKGSCERNHVLVRYIHYKGWSFDRLNQTQVNLLFSNIDSYPRKSLQNKTPYQSVLHDPRLGKEFLDMIDISEIDGDKVILTPSL